MDSVEEISTDPTQVSDLLTNVPSFDRHEYAETILRDAPKGLDPNVLAKYVNNNEIPTYSFDRLVRKLDKDVHKADAAVRANLPEHILQGFMEWKGDQVPARINFITHAQRKEHLFGLYDQVERAGRIDSKNYVLRSKGVNEVMGVEAKAYSPNSVANEQTGGGLIVDLSMNMYGAQSFYGNFIWVTLAGDVLSQKDYAFTNMAGPQYGFGGEVGVISPAAKLADKEIEKGTVREEALKVAKKEIEARNIPTGVALDKQFTFVLVPQDQYDEVLRKIDGLQIPDGDKSFLRSQIVSYNPEDDPLGSKLLENYQRNPTQFMEDMTRRGRKMDGQDLAVVEFKMYPQNFREARGSVGFEYQEWPELSGGFRGLDWLHRDLELIRSRLPDLELEDVYNQLNEAGKYLMLRNLDGFVRSLPKEADVVDQMSGVRSLLSKQVDQLSDDDKTLAENMKIDLKKVPPGATVGKYFENEYL